MVKFYKILFKIGLFFNSLIRSLIFRRRYKYKRMKLKLKDISPTRGRRFSRTEPDSNPLAGGYNWDKLKRRIKLFGLIKPLIVEQIILDDSLSSKATTYVVVDGNHRYIILNELYGEDYEVKCNVLDVGVSYFDMKPNPLLGLLPGNNYRQLNTPLINKTLNDIQTLKKDMLKESHERKVKLMQKYKINVRFNKKN